VNRSGRILLVEDNRDDEFLTLRAFSKGHFSNPIVVARDGQEALDLLVGSRATDFVLVLLDLRLPRVHGLEVLKRLRADDRTKIVPVVILTSSVEEPDLLKAYSLGANSYIRKPVDYTEFLNTVTQLGMYWLATNCRPSPAAAPPVLQS
jgi:two-component system, response regulator